MKTCPIHNVVMVERWKKDDPQHLQPSFFSHKTDEGEWCNGKVKQVNNDVKMLSDKLDKVLELLMSIGAREAVKPSKSDKPLPF